jgi:heme-degrading monooxygenase HmoA
MTLGLKVRKQLWISQMFAVIFEVNPKSSQWDGYLALGKMLKPELEQIDGFIENVRYRSLRREGWLVSLSQWRDEKALVRWRTQARHHDVQKKGRQQIFADYHLRIGQLTSDSNPPVGHDVREQRLDETKTGDATTVTLISATRPSEWIASSSPDAMALLLGLDVHRNGLIAWDVFDAVLTPGDLVLLISWRDKDAADNFENNLDQKQEARLRRVRIIRDYGMFDRREAPQYYADAEGAVTVHS